MIFQLVNYLENKDIPQNIIMKFFEYLYKEVNEISKSRESKYGFSILMSSSLIIWNLKRSLYDENHILDELTEPQFGFSHLYGTVLLRNRFNSIQSCGANRLFPNWIGKNQLKHGPYQNDVKYITDCVYKNVGFNKAYHYHTTFCNEHGYIPIRDFRRISSIEEDSDSSVSSSESLPYPLNYWGDSSSDL